MDVLLLLWDGGDASAVQGTGRTGTRGAEATEEGSGAKSVFY